MAREGMEEGAVSNDKEVKTAIEKAETTMAGVVAKFRNCPDCGLPTHVMQDGRTMHCSSCNEYYDIAGDGPDAGGMRKVTRRTSTRTKVIVFSSLGLVVLVISIVVLALVFYQERPSYIGIDDVNEIRGLPISDEVPKRSISPAELDRRIKESIDDEVREELRDLEWAYKALFIMPMDWDLVSIAENESSGDGIAGYYDTDMETMYIIGKQHSENYINYILSHEYTHALQDQNFELDVYLDVEDMDVAFTRTCVVEGDAVMTMERWAEENLNELDRSLLMIEEMAQVLNTLDFEGGHTNSVLSEMSYFPYTGGRDFVTKVHGEGGYDAVNDLFTARPPLSSEQVLHYEKYKEYERPLEVTFEGDMTGLTLERSTAVGEKLLSEMLMFNGGGSASGVSAAPGWGGDRLFRFRSGEGVMSVLVTKWDTEEANEDFSIAFLEMLDNIGEEENGTYSVNGVHVLMETHDDMTVVYSSSSRDLIVERAG